MRTIKFRAKRIDNNKWIYGSILECINVETVGQFTGVTDRNGNEIYEGDIVECDWTVKSQYNPALFPDGIKTYKNTADPKKQIKQVYFSEKAGGFVLTLDTLLSEKKYRDLIYLTAYRGNTFISVIGNIHDNPELLVTEKS